MKKYIRQRGYREIPVGYAAVNIPEIDLLSAEYFNCGADGAQSDFWAVNSFCNSNFVVSKWDQRVKNYTDYSKPIL
jgi:1,3-beta-glucanosyltransferase GAS5